MTLQRVVVIPRRRIGIQVMLLAAVMEGEGMQERGPADPYASRFELSGHFRRYGLLKGLGLPDRCQPFLRPFKAENRRLKLVQAAWASNHHSPRRGVVGNRPGTALQ